MKEPSYQLVRAIDGAFILVTPPHVDDRGFFYEALREEWGLPIPPMVQHNVSLSHGGVLRGLHLQKHNPQGKLVRAAFGTIRDVLFDLRPESPTFMRGFAVDLACDEGTALYVPPGVAHGFLVLSRHAVVQYSCTTYYDPETDGGVHWESAEVDMFFPVGINPTLSRKDAALPSVRQYLQQQRDEKCR